MGSRRGMFKKNPRSITLWLVLLAGLAAVIYFLYQQSDASTLGDPSFNPNPVFLWTD